MTRSCRQSELICPVPRWVPGEHLEPLSLWAAVCHTQHSPCMFHLQPVLDKASCKSSVVFVRPSSPRFQREPSIATKTTAGSGASTLPVRIQPSQHLLYSQVRSSPEDCLAAGRPQKWSAALDLPWLSEVMALLAYQSVSWFSSTHLIIKSLA